jgi:hypothetical protein
MALAKEKQKLKWPEGFGINGRKINFLESNPHHPSP